MFLPLPAPPLGLTVGGKIYSRQDPPPQMAPDGRLVPPPEFPDYVNDKDLTEVRNWRDLRQELYGLSVDAEPVH